MTDYDLCWFCDGTGDDGDWYCRVCKGQGVAERWVMEAESMCVGLSECYTAETWDEERFDEDDESTTAPLKEGHAAPGSRPHGEVASEP